MKLTKCAKKHYFDADKYAICPQCEAAERLARLEKMPTPEPVPDGQMETPDSGTRWDPAESGGEAMIDPFSFDAPFVKTENGSAFGAPARDPVVGWLVCVAGVYRGEGFPLRSGRNGIGRGAGMDVCLDRDAGVSEGCHAIATYEPEKRKFYIQPGEGRYLTYVNGEVLLVPREITDFHRIRMGNGEFILRTLCGEAFSWENPV